jgi:probable rRNA maturation factor
MKIQVTWGDESWPPVPKPFYVGMRQALRVALARFFEGEQARASFALSIKFVDNEEMRALNKAYREKDEPTDVLSFPADAVQRGREIQLGDIVISHEKARAQAAEYGHGDERELAFLATHGLLHLLGLDHETSESDAEIMNELQEEILTEVGLGV